MNHEILGFADAIEVGEKNLELVINHKDILPDPLTVALLCFAAKKFATPRIISNNVALGVP